VLTATTHETIMADVGTASRGELLVEAWQRSAVMTWRDPFGKVT